MHSILPLLSIHVFTAHAENVCTSSSFEPELIDKIAEAEKQYPLMEQGDFERVSREMLKTLECLEDTVQPRTAAAVHRIMGLRARVVDGDAANARVAFAAARRLDPEYVFPPEMIGPKDPEITDYTAVPTNSVAAEDIRPPVKGDIAMDGKSGDKRIINWPTVFQLRDAKGTVLETQYLWPNLRTPYYDAIPEGQLEVDELIIHRIVPAITAGLASAAVGAGGAMLSVGVWDSKNVCAINADENCTKGAKQRVAIGIGLVVAGLGGYGLTGGILAVKIEDDGAFLGWQGRF